MERMKIREDFSSRIRISRSLYKGKNKIGIYPNSDFFTVFFKHFRLELLVELRQNFLRKIHGQIVENK